MSMPRYAASVDLNQQEIIHELRQAGYTVLVLRTPVDIAIGHNARNYFFEIKRPGQKPRTKAQKQFLADWRKKGQADVIETAEQAIEVMQNAYKS